MGMQSILPEWYGHDDDTLESIYRTGTIALDANALLDLYRVNRDQREEILAVLTDVSDRLFIPYQAAYEFQKNRLKVVADNYAAHEKLSGAVQLNETLVNNIADPDLQREVRMLFGRLAKRFHRDIAKLRDEHALSLQEVRGFDPVRHALDNLLNDNNFGVPPDGETLSARKATSSERVKARIPPGFADTEKADASGDYLIWAELLEHKSQSDRPLLFVTNETKPDWVSSVNGQTVGPLPALISEMAGQSAHAYHQTSLSQFLRYAKESLGADVDESTITTVEKIAPQEDKPAPTLAPQEPGRASPLAYPHPGGYLPSGLPIAPAYAASGFSSPPGVAGFPANSVLQSEAAKFAQSLQHTSVTSLAASIQETLNSLALPDRNEVLRSIGGLAGQSPLTAATDSVRAALEEIGRLNAAPTSFPAAMPARPAGTTRPAAAKSTPKAKAEKQSSTRKSKED